MSLDNLMTKTDLDDYTNELKNYIANNSSDVNVAQTATTNNSDYEVLFSSTADNTTRTEGARKNSNLKFNPSTGNLQTTQLNGVNIGSSPKFTDTTYESKSAVSDGTELSLVTTGEKHAWNNKVDQVTGKGLSTNDYTDDEKQKNADNASAISDIQEDISQPLTATGNPLTIEAAESNLVECVAEVEAYQDLHGYDHPWVGGAGKNLYIGSPSFDGYERINAWAKQTETYNDHEVYKKGGTWMGMYHTINLPIGTYTFSAMVKVNTQATVYAFIVSSGDTATVDSQSSALTIPANTWTKITATFTVSVTGTVSPRCEIGVSDIDLYVSEYQLEAGSQATSYADYENISPITGQTEVVIEDCGKNLFDKNTSVDEYRLGSDGTLFAQSGYTASDFIRVNSSTNYVRNKAMNTNECVCLYDVFHTFISRITTGTTFTTTSATAFVKISMLTSDKDTVQLELGNTATDFEPYKGKTYTIQLGDTVYGGTLDVITGEFTVTHELWTKNTSTMNNTENYPGWVHCGIEELVGNGFDILIENQIMNIGTDYGVNTQVDYDILYLPRDTYGKTQTEWKALAQDIEIAVELATPYTIQLTPEQIRLFKGTNNISCNTGDLTIKYYPDNVLGQLKGDIESEYDSNPKLPEVTSADNGKFLCVVNGSWAADTVPSAESQSF